MTKSHGDQNFCTMNDEILVVDNLLSAVTLTSPDIDDSHLSLPLPTLSPDLVEEILCRLSVKFLCQLRCVCKSWNSLISDRKFAKKHLCHSTTCRIHFLSCSTRRIRSCVSHPPNNLLTSYPLDFIFTNEVTTNVTQLEYPSNNYLNYILRGSCNGILCLADYYNEGFILLCNPSLRKFKKLPHFQMPQVISHVQISYGFGYDHVNDSYKVVDVLNYYIGVILEIKTEVKVYTFGINSWKNLGEFPFDGIPAEFSGKFVSGTIYWLACKDQGTRKSPCFIVSFDLENESFQEVPKPDYENVDENFVNLGVLKDCLCLICGHDIWLMKKCQNKKSWIKLFTVSYLRDPSKSYVLDKAIYIFEDDQVLLESRGDWGLKLIVYDPKINTFKFTKFQNKSVYNSRCHGPEVSVESLILPWS